MSIEELAEGMLKLQKKGAHNLNLVTPTHQVAAVARALVLAVPRGLRLPVVYNTSGYESVETLRLLEGIVDVYLPDIKFADADIARFCSNRADYVVNNRAALLEMWRQAGPMALDEEGVAYKGMLVRHMVLPKDLSGTYKSLKFLSDNMGPRIWVSLMNQYFPAHKGLRTPPLDRKVTPEEYETAFRALMDLNLDNGFVQEHCADDPIC
jgi:putative pyruvate formate lyase activating enzyme